MRRPFAGLAALALAALTTPEARAAMQAECEQPSAFAGPVQVFAVQYAFEPDPADWELNDRLQETARRLSYLIQRDVLANDSFGSLAVILLHENDPGACRAAEVQERLLQSGSLRPGQAMALIWGRIFLEEDDVYVQSYLRFLRVDPREPRYVEERFTISLAEPAQRLEGGLPTQSIAFVPRKLRTSDLDRIDRAWQAASVLHEAPRDDAPGQPLPPPEVPLAYYVHEMTPDGWLGVELQFGGRGWLKADSEVRRALRELMPELDYVEAVIGYLSYRQAKDGRDFPTDAAPWMLRRIEDRFASFARSDPDPASNARVLAATLSGALRTFASPGDAASGIELLRKALGYRPEDGALRNLVAMAHLVDCCAARGGAPGPGLEQAPQMLLAGLAVDPNNQDLLGNLQATYAWIAAESAGPGGAGAPLARATVRVNANLRAGPTTDSRRIALATSGSELTVVGTSPDGDWLRIDRGREPDAYIAAYLMRDIRPIPGASARLECAGQGEGMRCSSRPEPVPGHPLDQGDATERLAEAGLAAEEVGARLQQVKELRQALGQSD